MYYASFSGNAVVHIRGWSNGHEMTWNSTEMGILSAQKRIWLLCAVLVFKRPNSYFGFSFTIQRNTEQRTSNIRAANKCHNFFLLVSLIKYKLNGKEREGKIWDKERASQVKDKCGIKVRWRDWHRNGKNHEAKGQFAQLQKVQGKTWERSLTFQRFPCMAVE